MAQRMQQGGRPGGARFAQFKLVLLGVYRLEENALVCRTNTAQASPRSERARLSSALSRYDTASIRHDAMR